MKKINLYLLALSTILIKCLALGFNWPEVAAMGILLCKLAHDAHIDSKKVIEKLNDEKKEAEQEKRLKDIEIILSSHSNTLKFLNQTKR